MHKYPTKTGVFVESTPGKTDCLQSGHSPVRIRAAPLDLSRAKRKTCAPNRPRQCGLFSWMSSVGHAEKAGASMVPYRKSRDRQPKLTHHRARGQGVARLNGKDVYYGLYNTPECRARYLRAPAAWEAASRRPADIAAAERQAESNPATPVDLTINELVVAYRTHGDSYYVKNGE